MTPDEMASLYQWNYRPHRPRRPAGFDSWPGGARMAVQLIMLHEWESVPRPEVTLPLPAIHPLDSRALGVREYGVRFGFWRLMELLDKHEVKVTLMVNGLVCELFPETVTEAHHRGHEVANHQWDQAISPMAFKTREEERDSFRRTQLALEGLTGERVLGYMSPGPRPTAHTLELCVEAGFFWTADYNDSDIPYVINVTGQRLISVGYVAPGFTDNDLARMGPPIGLQALISAFDVLYAESARRPTKLCYAFHSHVSGRPAMTSVLDQFLTHVRSRSDVWFCRAIDLARFWDDLDRAG
jgi:allantoinase